MSVQTTMSVEEYRRTSFEGADCDYVDGDLEERNMGEIEHSTVQLELAVRLKALSSFGIDIKPEIRIQTAPTRFRVADVAVWRVGQLPATGVPPVPPFLAIEILSPEDRLVRLQGKVQEYLAAGVDTVWVIDPRDRAAMRFTRAVPQGEILTDTLTTADPPIAIPLAELWPA